MQTTAHPHQRFELTPETEADQALIDALDMENSVFVDGTARAANNHGGWSNASVTLLVDCKSEKASVVDAGRQALSTLRNLFRLGSGQGGHDGHVCAHAANPETQEPLTTLLKELKLVLDPLRDVVVEQKAMLEKMNCAHGGTPVVTEAAILTDTPPTIGQVWPTQGGIYLGVYRGEHLIVATSPESRITGAWGEYGRDLAGAKSRFDGRENTKVMALQGCEIAEQVYRLSDSGRTGWFIPAKGQLTYAAAVAPEAFESGYHWSSTQYSRDHAFVQDFEGGGSGWTLKGNERRVRAFRGLPLQPLNTSAVQG